MIEILASGIGVDQDSATLNAMKSAVETETRVLIDSKTIVENGKTFYQSIVTRSCAYITSYTIKSVESTESGWKVRVLCKVDERKLAGDFKSYTPLALDGPMLGILAYQNQQRQNDVKRATEERRALIAHQQELLEKFISNTEFRQEFPIKVETVKASFDDVNVFTVDITPSLPDFSVIKNILEQKRPHFSTTLELLDNQGKVLYSDSRVCFYPWRTVSFYGPTDSELLSKVKNVRVKW